MFSGFFMRVFIYGRQKLSAMGRQDKIRACYQHCCLLHEGNKEMTNQSVRERFEIDKKNFPIASRIINDTLASGLIKVADPENISRKFASYVPYYAYSQFYSLPYFDFQFPIRAPKFPTITAF
jgi:predicted HTH transcriptional regulator